jgi:hypothetical protein
MSEASAALSTSAGSIAMAGVPASQPPDGGRNPRSTSGCVCVRLLCHLSPPAAPARVALG